MPVFFGLTGLKTDLSVLFDPTILLLAVGLIVIASVGKFAGASSGICLPYCQGQELYRVGLYIVGPRQKRSLSRVSDIANGHVAAAERIDEIAKYYGVSARKIVREDDSPELSILRHARRGRYDLIILGVSRRVGEDLSYGRIADTLLEAADRSFAFIETQ